MLMEVQDKGLSPDTLATATAYVTLEPCHRGPGKSTPPCDEAIVASGIRAVHVAVVDPDPAFGGVGVAYMRENGLQVTVGTGARAVERSLAPYLHQRRRKRPYVVLKVRFFLSLDPFLP